MMKIDYTHSNQFNISPHIGLIDTYYTELASISFYDISQQYRIPFTHLIETQKALNYIRKWVDVSEVEPAKILTARSYLLAHYGPYMRLSEIRSDELMYNVQDVIDALDAITDVYNDHIRVKATIQERGTNTHGSIIPTPKGGGL
jgi:hypothetical protein